MLFSTNDDDDAPKTSAIVRGLDSIHSTNTPRHNSA